jgi:hypothetical protein
MLICQFYKNLRKTAAAKKIHGHIYRRLTAKSQNACRRRDTGTSAILHGVVCNLSMVSNKKVRIEM